MIQKTMLIMIACFAICSSQISWFLRPFDFGNANMEIYCSYYPYDSMRVRSFVERTECDTVISKYLGLSMNLKRLYDKSGKLTCCVLMGDKNVERYKELYKYNDKCRLIVMETYGLKGDRDEKDVYFYNDKNQLIELQNLDEDDELDEKFIYQYDQKTGFLKKCTVYDDDGLITETIINNSYDKKGNCTEKTVFDESGKMNENVKIKYEYY